MSNGANWWVGELDLEVNNDLYGEFYSVPMKQHADLLEKRSDFQDYFETEHATARRLNVAYEGVTLISTDLLEDGFIDALLIVMNRAADGRVDEAVALAKELYKKFYEETNNDA